MIVRKFTETKAQKTCSDKGTKFRGAFKRFCEVDSIAAYSAYSDKKTAFAIKKQKDPQSMEKFTNKLLEKKWLSQYINKLQSSVHSIRSGARRNYKELVPVVVSLQTEQNEEVGSNIEVHNKPQSLKCKRIITIRETKQAKIHRGTFPN